MSISQNFPNTRPSLNLNFARSKTLDPRITFSRTSTGTYVDESGFIRDAVADEPRFDHDPVTGECLGLLVEESRKNMVTYSEDFTQWVNTNTTDAVDTSVTAPDGTNTATKITDDSTNAAHNVKLYVGTDSSDTFTLSCFVKKGDFSYFIIVLRLLVNGNNSYGKFDLDNLSNNTTYGDGTNRSQTVTEYPNGWYRISFTTTFSAASTNVNSHIHLTASGGDTSYSGSGNYNYIWGAQVEVGAFPTSYIPTSGSTATRNPDSVTMTGDNFSDWYNSSEWTLMIAARRNYSGNFLTYPNLARINDGTANNNVAFYGAQGSTQFTNYGIYSGGAEQTPYVAINVPTTSQFKMIQALKENDSTFGGNGTLTTTDTSVLMPVGVNQLLIGSDGGNGRWGATIQQLTYYPVRLPNSTLQTLTK